MTKLMCRHRLAAGCALVGFLGGSLLAPTTGNAGEADGFEVLDVTFGGQPPSRRTAAPDALDDSTLQAAVDEVAADPDATVVAEVFTDLDLDAATALVERHGGIVKGDVPGWFVLAEVPASELEALAAEADVARVSAPTRVDGVNSPGAFEQAGQFNGEHVAKTGAAAWHSAGITGAGVKIGIIDSFGKSIWDAAQATGDVRQPEGLFCQQFGDACGFWDVSDPTASHGVSVAETISDMAPGARYYLAHVATRADVKAAIDYFADHGVRVISRSLSAVYDGPGDGTGPSADLVRYAIGRGITWVNSAGNAADGSYFRERFNPRQITINGNNGPENWVVHQFGNGQAVLPFTCGFQLGLRWNDWGSGDTTDYDLYIMGSFDGGASWDFTEFGSWNDQPNAKDDGQNRPFGIDPAAPLERSDNCPDQPGMLAGYLIRMWAPGQSTDNDELELMINNGQLGISTHRQSATQPFADLTDPGAFSVGAVGDEPRGGGTTIASYSSQGPNNAGEIVPTIAASTCVTVQSMESSCFNGTSAATPVVSGAVALVLQSGAASSPVGVWNFLRNRAVDRGDAGPDNAFGAGELMMGTPPLRPIRGIDPARLVETRNGVNDRTVDGKQEAIGRRAAGQVTEVEVGGRAGVPKGASAALLNVTAIGPSGPGYLTVYPCGAERPQASNVNYVRGQVVPNAVLSGLGTGGKVCVYTREATDLVVDVNGYVPSDGSPRPVVPARLFESRSGGSTTDGKQNNAGRLGAREVARIDVAGRGNVPANATAVMLNVTAVNPAAAGYLTVFPCGSNRPNASNVNYLTGQVVPNAVLAAIGTEGRVCVYSSAATDLIVDVNGYVPPRGAPDALVPARLYESRAGQTTTDGVAQATGRRDAGSVTDFVVTGRGGVAEGADGVFLNVTAVAPGAAGYLTVYPCGATRPNASNVNYLAGQVVPNAVFSRIGDGGRVCVYSSAATDLVIDVSGYSD